MKLKRQDYFILVLLGTIIALELAYIGLNDYYTERGYEYTDIQAECAEIKKANDQLQQSINYEKSLAVLEQRALERGFRKATPADYIYIQ